MIRKLVITIAAQHKLENIFEYLESKWSAKESSKFANKVKDSLHHIVKNPNLFPKSNFKKEIHRCIISKQVSLFYTYDNNSVTVLEVFDNRQDPDNIITSLETKTN